MTQAELAEILNVSRQAISKWEMGTAVPDVTNMMSLSKLFNVSVDYLVNDELETEEDSPAVKAASGITKINYQYILMRVIIAFCVVTSVSIVGIITHSFASMAIFLIIIGFIFLIYYGMRLLMLFFSNRKKK
ncbi:helix-turn-helix transcriptional regulator [Enterocloster clostridioformis]|nr:helix-turn-helix transcriptional regulator [Enterocloster clostridioformis]